MVDEAEIDKRGRQAMSKQRYSLFGGVLASFCISVVGCNSAGPEPSKLPSSGSEEILGETATAFYSLVDVLAPISDAKSARATLSVLDQRYAAVIDALKAPRGDSIQFEHTSQPCHPGQVA